MVSGRSRIQIAKPDIVRHFDELPSHVLKLKEIQAIVTSQRTFWRLAQNTTAQDFIGFLRDHAKLRQIEFAFPQRTEQCYVWGDVPLLSILLSLRKGLYLSHYTAMRVHGLTEQSPTTVYLTEERSSVAQLHVRPQIGQAEIDESFRRPPRVSHNWIEYAGRKVYLLNGAYTNHLGIVTADIMDDDGRSVHARLTNLERTLIDITVRPVYAGGVFEVAKAFELARDHLSVNRLIPMLRKLDFLFPYHQAIGFYLERAGYKSSQIDLVRRLPMEYDFFLTSEINKTRYDSNWRLLVPEGL
jgi:predicted transcriptional regulator of viral defense system